MTPPAAARPAGSYTRAYIRHLLKAEELLGMRFWQCMHNLWFYNHLMERIRDATGRWHVYGFPRPLCQAA